MWEEQESSTCFEKKQKSREAVIHWARRSGARTHRKLKELWFYSMLNEKPGEYNDLIYIFKSLFGLLSGEQLWGEM